MTVDMASSPSSISNGKRDLKTISLTSTATALHFSFLTIHLA